MEYTLLQAGYSAGLSEKVASYAQQGWTLVFGYHSGTNHYVWMERPLTKGKAGFTA